MLNSLFVSLLKNSADIVLQPFNDLSDIYDDIVYIADVVQYIGDKNEYALAEIRSASINWITTKAIGALENVPGKVGKLTGKFSKVLLVAGILYDTYHIARDQTRLPGNYAIQIDITSSSGVDTFIGD